MDLSFLQRTESIGFRKDVQVDCLVGSVAYDLGKPPEIVAAIGQQPGLAQIVAIVCQHIEGREPLQARDARIGRVLEGVRRGNWHEVRRENRLGRRQAESSEFLPVNRWQRTVYTNVDRRIKALLAVAGFHARELIFLTGLDAP